MFYTRGQTGEHSFGVHSRIPDHEKRSKCQAFVHNHKEKLCGLITILLLGVLHWNFNVDSKWDDFHVFSCSEGSYFCSLLFGCFENVLFALCLVGIYYSFFYFYFRVRYHFPTTDFLAGIDAYIIALPWLISPLLKWYSITSLIIDCSQLFDSLFLYEYPLTETDIDGVRRLFRFDTAENINDGIEVQNNVLMEKNTNVAIIDSPTVSYYLDPYTVLVAAFIRTLWSFILWNGLDRYLWSNKYLLWLFENGPNKAIISLKSEHQRMIYRILLPYFNNISDLTKLFITFADDSPPMILLDIKQSIYTSLKHDGLRDSFKWFSIVTAVMSAFRLWYCPSVGYIFAPVLIIIGIVIVVLIVILAILEGDPGSLNCHDCSRCGSEFFIVFGVFGAAICWGYFIWWCMQKRLKILKELQEKKLVNSTFQHRLARTVYNL